MGPAAHPGSDQIELLQEIKGKDAQGQNEAHHRQLKVPAVIVVGLIKCVSVAVALVHPMHSEVILPHHLAKENTLDKVVDVAPPS